MTFNRRRQKEVKVRLLLPKEPAPQNSMAINGGRRRLRRWEGWGLGPFAAMLQSLHLDTPLLEQQNTKKLYGTTNNCMHAQWGFSNSGPKRYKRDKKKNLPPWKNLEGKHGVGNKSRILHKPHLQTSPQRWAKHLSHPSGPTDRHTSTLKLVPLSEQARKGRCCWLSLNPFCSRAAVSLAWSSCLPSSQLVHFYWLGKAKNSGW